jgi:hypothetical protein
VPLFAFVFDFLSGAVAAAVGAVSVPIIIHLLNRRRFKIVTWAAMRFLLNAQRKNSRRMRLEQIILLATRCLLILLLLAAMVSVTGWAEAAWRALFPESVGWVKVAGHRTHKIVVVDGSFSMAAKAGDTNAFDRAREMAKRIVTESQRGDGFSVVLMSAPPRRVVPEPAEDPNKVAREIDKLRLPHGNADLVATLNTVEGLLHASPEKYEEREVYFLTDLQKSTWLLRQPGTVSQTLQKIQARARTVFVDVGQDGLANLAVTSLSLHDPLATVGSEAAIDAVVYNFGPETREGVNVELRVGKARATSDDPPMEVHVAQQKVENLKTGSNNIAFHYKFTAPGDYLLQVHIDSGDALELDDTRSAVVTVKNNVPIMLVDGKSTEPELLDRGAEWLNFAVYPPPPKGAAAPASDPFRPKVLTESQFADVGLGDLTDYDCVCFCDVGRLSAAEVRRLETHLRRGGGAVFWLGDQVDLGAYNESLYRNGQGILPARLEKKQAAKDRTWFQFKDGDYKLPPLKEFGSSPDYQASLESGRFTQYVKAVLADRGGPRRVMSYTPVAAPGPKGPSLEGMPIGDPALVEWQPPAAAFAGDNPQAARDRAPGAHARGHVILMTSTANMDWTSWPGSPSYVAFVQELMRFAVSGRLREQALTVGDPIEEFLSPGAGALDAKIETPDQRKESGRTLSTEESNVLRWADTDISGVYRVTLGRDPQEHLFAVNVPAATLAEEASESDLARTNKDELSHAYPEWGVQVVTDLADVNHTGGPSADPDKDRVPAPIGPDIAHYLLLAVLALVFVEVLMAWRFGHYSATASNEPVPASGSWLPALAVGVVVLGVLAIGGTLLHWRATGEFLGFLPDRLHNGIDRLLGNSEMASGEASHWGLDFRGTLWDSDADPWLMALIAVAGTALFVLIYRQEASATSAILRVVFVGLRVGLLLLVLFVFWQPDWVFERQGLPDVVVLIDDSQSMTIKDNYQDDAVRAAAEALARDADLSEPDRLSLAKALVTRPKGDWLATLLTKRKAKVHVYHCSTRAARVADVTEPEQLDAAVKAVKGLESGPQNDSSQLGTAVRQVINDYRGSSLAAVIMLTDGVTTEGEDLGKVSKYASQMGVPLFFVGVGDSREAKDLDLHDLQSEDSVYVNDNIIFTARLTGHGFGDLTVPVELREKGKNEVLATQNVKVDPSGKPEKVRLNYKPKEEGEKIFELRVPVQDGEVNVENNVAERTVFVRKTKLIKVLYVEGEPRWEFRYVKTLLERENQLVEGNKSFELSVWLTDADPEWAEQDKSAKLNGQPLKEFPLKRELQAFDVVILGDFDLKKVPKINEHLQDVADFVKERGGGLLVIAGERYSPHCYKGTPLQDVLPIDLLTDRQPGEPAGGLTDPYRPELTPVGRLHPIFSFNSRDEKENDDIWNGLKEMYWWSEGYEAKRAAEVLATHPRIRRAGKNGAAKGGLDGHPLVVQQFVGSGRSLFFGWHETWRWRWRDNELHFNQFWVQTMRYLARSRTGKIELRLDKQTPYQRGEPIRVTVRFPDDAPPPPPETEVKVLVERRPPKGNGGEIESQTLTLSKVEGSRSNFEALLTRTPEGDYTFLLNSPPVQGPKPKAECKVLAPPGEMEVQRMNQAEMERAAEETRGHFYTLADADQVLTDLPPGLRVTLNASGPPMHLWNMVWVFCLALSLLTLEWVLRKRKNLL